MKDYILSLTATLHVLVYIYLALKQIKVVFPTQKYNLLKNSTHCEGQEAS